MGDDAARYVLAISTAGSADEARRIARQLVDGRLAACVNLVDRITSVYAWKGEICEESEVLMLMKTEADRFEALRSAIRTAHSYDVPEVIAIPLSAGDEDYLGWITKCLAGES